MEDLLIPDHILHTPFIQWAQQLPSQIAGKFSVLSIPYPATIEMNKKRKAKLSRVNILNAAKKQLQAFGHIARVHTQPTDVHRVNIEGLVS